MRSALVVHSKHTRNYARRMAKIYTQVDYLQVNKPPTELTISAPRHDTIVAIGGGSVIDTAKIIAGKDTIIAIPTTAAGAACTATATVWVAGNKVSVVTAMPILKNHQGTIKLPPKVRKHTRFDCQAHAIEACWHKHTNETAKHWASMAITRLNLERNDYDLIAAGNCAGRAIAASGTNVVHAVSYALTILYNVPHGKALGMLLAPFVQHFGIRTELPNLKIDHIKMPERFSAYLIVTEAMRYKRIHYGPHSVKKSELLKLVERCKE